MEYEGDLQERFRKAGKKHGYETVNSELTAHKDLKVRWQRYYRLADLKVYDYLIDAPPEVIDGSPRRFSPG